jgi:hypothetical protein
MFRELRAVFIERRMLTAAVAFGKFLGQLDQGIRLGRN